MRRLIKNQCIRSANNNNKNNSGNNNNNNNNRYNWSCSKNTLLIPFSQAHLINSL